jgi:hypothetical protein
MSAKKKVVNEKKPICETKRDGHGRRDSDDRSSDDDCDDKHDCRDKCDDAAAADFYGLMPPDNATTVAAGTAVSFPQNGIYSGGSTISRLTASTFNLAKRGVYKVEFQVSVTEPGQLVIALDNGTGFIEVPNSVVGRATGASQIVGVSLIKTMTRNTKLAIWNPTGNAPPLTITPLAGGTHPVSCHLVITRIE